ncbi:hypothetical protein [Pseudoalteromonas sp.]|uniref:hypothetical protein n=1 Tax=Pseudoalteromonas sp. TaxID=53249 RepID=UPI003D125225
MRKITEHSVCGEIVLVWHPKPDDDGYCISLKSGGWLKGTYDSVDSALIGAKFDLELNEGFYLMQERVNHFDKEGRLISISDFELIKSRNHVS